MVDTSLLTEDESSRIIFETAQKKIFLNTKTHEQAQ
jgi:hypothetical protein